LSTRRREGKLSPLSPRRERVRVRGISSLYKGMSLVIPAGEVEGRMEIDEVVVNCNHLAPCDGRPGGIWGK